MSASATKGNPLADGGTGRKTPSLGGPEHPMSTHVALRLSNASRKDRFVTAGTPAEEAEFRLARNTRVRPTQGAERGRGTSRTSLRGKWASPSPFRRGRALRVRRRP